eukprot:scaffold142163_cov28-Tisochrysis_lutea.AAC.3
MARSRPRSALAWPTSSTSLPASRAGRSSSRQKGSVRRHTSSSDSPRQRRVARTDRCARSEPEPRTPEHPAEQAHVRRLRAQHGEPARVGERVRGTDRRLKSAPRVVLVLRLNRRRRAVGREAIVAERRLINLRAANRTPKRVPLRKPSQRAVVPLVEPPTAQHGRRRPLFAQSRLDDGGGGESAVELRGVDDVGPKLRLRRNHLRRQPRARLAPLSERDICPPSEAILRVPL